jgi:hypothetical protein
LTDIEQVIVPGHSLSNVDAAYFTALLEQRNVAAATGLSLASPSMTGLRSERNFDGSASIWQKLSPQLGRA